MFTGLIQCVGTVEEKKLNGKAGELVVQTSMADEQIELGESIAVNGVCLTVTRCSQGLIAFHTLAETLDCTNLKTVRKGSHVNLERALRLGDRLGGHLVSGHIDGQGNVLSIGKTATGDMELTLSLPDDLAPLVVHKGSIALNGVSLTIARLKQGALTVCIIPHTWSHTNLCDLRANDKVNIETDIFGRYILRQMELKHPEKTSAVTMEMLDQAGYF